MMIAIPGWYTKRVLTVGIDIDANTIKLVALKKRSAVTNTFELVSYAHIITTAEFPSISGAVQTALQQANINKKSKIVLALPYGQILAKTIRVGGDCHASPELENNIMSHCQKIIAYPIHEACVDFEIIGALENKSSGCDVRVVIARRDAVEEKVNLFSASDFSIAAVDVESDALARSIYYVLNQNEGNDKEKICIAIHIAGQKILGLVLFMGEIVFTQEIVISVTDPSGIKQKNYLEKIKILFPILDLAAHTFSKTKKTPGNLAGSFYLSGCCLSEEGFRSGIDEIVCKRSCLVNPFNAMNKSDAISLPHLEKHAHSLVVSCGLAMRDFHGGD